MKRVLLLGDSIRMGYDKKVRALLQQECEVIFAEDDNGRFAAYTLWQANQLFKQYGRFDIVHWNNGYWDMNIEPPMTEPMHPAEEYVHFLKRIIRLLCRNGAKIIFATSLPVCGSGNARDDSGTTGFLQYDNRWVIQYNDAACRLMQEEGIEINDLYALCMKKPGYYKAADRLHLTEAGYWEVAKQTADCIRRCL